MHKAIKSIIGLSVALVILVMAYRFSGGAGGTAKIGEIEISVDANSQIESPVPVNAHPKSEKITKQFVRDFDFTNHSCGIDTDISVQKCVDAGYRLMGMTGQVTFTSKDRCGSRFISFNATNDNCGDLTVHLQGCGFDSLNTCKGNAYLRGNIVLQGNKL